MKALGEYSLSFFINQDIKINTNANAAYVQETSFNIFSGELFMFLAESRRGAADLK